MQTRTPVVCARASAYSLANVLSSPQEGFDCRNFSGGFRLYETVTGDRMAAGEALPCGMEINR